MKTPLLSLILLFFISSFAFASNLELVDGEIRSGQIFVACNIDNQIQRCFMDTGARKSSLVKNKFSDQFASFGTEEMGGASGKKLTCDKIRVPSFSLSDLIEKNDFELLRCDKLKKGTIGVNTVGIDYFKNKVTYFDFSINSILELDSIPSDMNAYDLKILNQGHISMNINVNSLDSEAIFDTGAGLTAVDQGYVNENKEGFNFIQDIDNGFDATGKKLVMKHYQVDEITIGNVVFKDLYIIGIDFTPFRKALSENTNFILGYNLITKANWALDLKNNNWSISEK